MYHSPSRAHKAGAGLNIESLKPIQREFQPYEQDQGISARGTGTGIDDVLHIMLDCNFR